MNNKFDELSRISFGVATFWMIAWMNKEFTTQNIFCVSQHVNAQCFKCFVLFRPNSTSFKRQLFFILIRSLSTDPQHVAIIFPLQLSWSWVKCLAYVTLFFIHDFIFHSTSISDTLASVSLFSFCYAKLE